MTQIEQLPREAIGKLSPRALLQARRDGALDAVLRGEDPGAEVDPVDDEQHGGDDEHAPRSPRPNPAQGANGSAQPPPHAPRHADELRGLTPDQINKLRHEGKLDALMGRPARRR